MTLRKICSLASLCIAILGCTTLSLADRVKIVGGSTLLSSADASQLQAWLGAGDIQLTKVFSHELGDGKTSYDFHAAADGKGPTFTVVSAQYTDPNGEVDRTALVGGYNPESWNSSSGWRMVPDDSDRTAFLFNLTTGVKQNENLFTKGMFDTGAYQTYNWYTNGPTFGGGYDLTVGYATDLDLIRSYGLNYSFGGTSWQANVLGMPYRHFTFIDLGFEEFTIQQAQTPEPASLFLLGSGLAALVAMLRKR